MAQSNEVLRSVTSSYEVGDPCYALYYGPRHSHQPRWVPAIVTKRHGTRNVNVQVLPQGPILETSRQPTSTTLCDWRWHVSRQWSQRRSSIGFTASWTKTSSEDGGYRQLRSSSGHRTSDTTVGPAHSEYGPENPRRSERVRQPRKLYCCWGKCS